MALETATLIHQLDPANPAGPDRLASGDDHIRMIKAAIKNTFPNINSPILASDEALNALAGLATPVGIISLWYGSAAAIPSGYAICDGTLAAKSDATGTIQTPDLRGRVPVGANATNATGALFGGNEKTATTTTGGAHNHLAATVAGSGSHSHAVTIEDHVLTIAEMPNHKHNVPVKTNSGTGNMVEDADGSGGGQMALTEGEGGGLGHKHGASLVAGTDSTHMHGIVVDAVPAHSHSVTLDVVQASIALHFIMKV